MTMKGIKKVTVTAVAFAFIAIAVPGLEVNAQKDIYDVVGATDTISNTDTEKKDSKKKETTDKETDKAETPKTLVSSDVEDTRDILKDIRTMELGILFACAWGAGAVTYGNFRPLRRIK